MPRILFMGSPEIAVPALRGLHAAGHEIVAVITQPDRPKGRGQLLSAPAVKLAANSLGLPVLQPEKINTPDFKEKLKALNPDFICVVAYGKILGRDILKSPSIAPINLHFSLLPKYRGASCVAYALLHGDEETGVTTILMDEGLDTGPILMQWSQPIQASDTAETLANRLAQLGAKALVKTVEAVDHATLQAVPQNNALASTAPLLNKEMGRVDWGQANTQIYNQFRALTPWPGVFSFLKEKRMVFTAVQPLAAPSTRRPGSLEITPEDRLLAHCGRGVLEILALKPEGKSVLQAADFVRGLKGKETQIANLEFR